MKTRLFLVPAVSHSLLAFLPFPPVVFVLVFMQGCSIYTACKQPGPCYVERVKVGCSMTEVRSVLGDPKRSEIMNGDKVDTHEFVDGLAESGKVRVFFYGAGDAVFICVPELMFWPVELIAMKGTEGRAIVTYDTNAVVKAVSVTKRDGQSWVYKHRKE
jgi:hypothetical protein